jgi:hypothetical protein
MLREQHWPPAKPTDKTAATDHLCYPAEIPGMSHEATFRGNGTKTSCWIWDGGGAGRRQDKRCQAGAACTPHYI